MLLFDRYLLRQFVQVFVICYCSLTGLYIVIDAFGNLEEFSIYADKQGGLALVLAEYYGYRAISFFDLTSSVLALIAAMFTMTWIQRHNELTAVQAAGIPKGRIVKPVMIACLGVALAAALLREAIIPVVRHKFSRSAQDLAMGRGKTLQPRFDNRTDVLLRGRRAYPEDQRISEPNFLLPNGLARYGNQLVAVEARYVLPAAGRPGGYLLRDVSQPRELLRNGSLVIDDLPVVLTPHDYPDWLQPNECFVASEVTFEHLTDTSSFRDFASTPELIRAVHNPSLDFGADVRVAIHGRVVRPVLDMTLLLLGLPLVLTRGNRNLFIAIGLCLGVVVAFWLIVLGFQYLGRSYLINPALAAWGPLLLLGPAAAAMSEPLWE